METGTLRPHHRARLAELLEATDAFHEDESELALSLFDRSATTAIRSRRLRVHPRRTRETLGAGGRLLLVETSSRADYARTREFYAHAGFAEAARVRDFYAPADDRIMLTTRLTTREGGVVTR